MAWPEVAIAKTEKRHELVLSGSKFNERIDKDGLDATICELTTLNYLNIHETHLSTVPDDIRKLQNLQTLVLHSNRLSDVNARICELEKLKVLDVSGNVITQLPDLSSLTALTTLNLSSNRIESLPDLSKNTKLIVLDVSNNKLTDFEAVCHKDLTGLSDVKLNSNRIETVPENIYCLSSLKNLDLSNNQIKVIPGELASCTKLKDINLKNNPVVDRRLFKLIEQCRTKQIVDYVRQHCVRQQPAANNAKKGGKKMPAVVAKRDGEGNKEPEEKKYKIYVKHFDDELLKVVVDESVKAVRPHILTCVVNDVVFTEDNFKKFIQLQTRLHDGICKKRNAATIATHDADKLGSKVLTYKALPPDDFEIRPLNRPTSMTASALFTKLQNEAENLRKENKRNVYSGIHKYLYLLDGKKVYPCLMSNDKDVISFPPITNSDLTKISVETKSILFEVTSSSSQAICKNVLDDILKEMLPLFGAVLMVLQVKNTDLEGNLKAVYPSRTDLIFEDKDSIDVIRE